MPVKDAILKRLRKLPKGMVLRTQADGCEGVSQANFWGGGGGDILKIRGKGHK